MKNVLSTFFKANKVRTKLLLFIDQEIQFKIKNNELKNNILKYDKTKFCQNHVKTYTYQPNQIFLFSMNMFDFSNFKKEKKIADSKKSFSTCEDTPESNNILTQPEENLFNIHYLNSSLNKKTSYYDNILFRKKYYSIHQKSKHSSTFQIYEKPKADKKYLKNLCNSLKIPSKEHTLTSFNKINCKFLVNNINKKGNSSIVQKLKKTNKHNSHF